jgi:hypothetical protein
MMTIANTIMGVFLMAVCLPSRKLTGWAGA